MTNPAAELNRKLVEAVVKLRVRDCTKRLLIRPERMAEVEQTVIGRLLSGFFADGTTDPLNDLSLALIEGEVEVEIAEVNAVVALACLNSVGVFDKRHNILTEFVDPATRSTHWANRDIRSIHGAFPFSSVFDAVGLHETIVSEGGRLVLAVFAREKGCPEVKFEVVEADPTGARKIENPTILPARWNLAGPDWMARP